MLDILNIPLPALPAGARGTVMALMAMTIGLVLLLLGRRLWRFVAAAMLAGVGLALAAPLTERWGFWVSYLVVGVGLTLLGLLLARMVWAALLAGALGATALVVLLHYMLPISGETPPGSFDAAGMSLSHYAGQALSSVRDWLKFMTARHANGETWIQKNSLMATTGVGIMAALTGLTIGIVRPIFTRIFATTVLGAAMTIGGGCMMIATLTGSGDFLSGIRGWILLGAGGVLWVFGLLCQYRGELRSERKQEKTTEAAPPKEQ